MSEKPPRGNHASPIDQFFHAYESRVTVGLSPSSAMLAYLDWAVHLANSPGKQAELFKKALRKSVRFTSYAARLLTGKEEGTCIEPLPQDHRFDAPDWQQLPFSLWFQWFLLIQQWWHNATVGVEGVSRHHEELVAFSARQILDVFSIEEFAGSAHHAAQQRCNFAQQLTVRGIVASVRGPHQRSEGALFIIRVLLRHTES